jgi:hypothetical protein
MIISNIGQLRELIADLPDDMGLEGMDGEVPVIFVADYDDIPQEQRPQPVLCIEL